MRTLTSLNYFYSASKFLTNLFSFHALSIPTLRWGGRERGSANTRQMFLKIGQQLFTKIDRQLFLKVDQQMLTKIGQQLFKKLDQQMLTKIDQQLFLKIDQQSDRR